MSRFVFSLTLSSSLCVLAFQSQSNPSIFRSYKANSKFIPTNNRNFIATSALRAHHQFDDQWKTPKIVPCKGGIKRLFGVASVAFLLSLPVSLKGSQFISSAYASDDTAVVAGKQRDSTEKVTAGPIDGADKVENESTKIVDEGKSSPAKESEVTLTAAEAAALKNLITATKDIVKAAVTPKGPEIVQESVKAVSKAADDITKAFPSKTEATVTKTVDAKTKLIAESKLVSPSKDDKKDKTTAEKSVEDKLTIKILTKANEEKIDVSAPKKVTELVTDTTKQIGKAADKVAGVIDEVQSVKALDKITDATKDVVAAVTKDAADESQEKKSQVKAPEEPKEPVVAVAKENKVTSEVNAATKTLAKDAADTKESERKIETKVTDEVIKEVSKDVSKPIEDTSSKTESSDVNMEGSSSIEGNDKSALQPIKPADTIDVVIVTKDVGKTIDELVSTTVASHDTPAVSSTY